MAKINDKLTHSNWPRITLTNVRINGNSAQVYTTAGLFETQRIILQKTGLPDLDLTIASILDERFVVLRSGKQPKIEDFSAYDDCLLTAPDQARPKVETNPVWQTFQEFPASAVREMQVTHHGNPLSQQSGQIDLEQPETRFVYNAYCQLSEIREFVRIPSAIYTGNVQIQIDGTLTVDPQLPWMFELNNTFVYYELNAGVPVNHQVYTIIEVQGSTIKVSPVPLTEINTAAILDSRIGHRLKSTKFIGECCIERSYNEFESVTMADITGNT